MAYPLEESASKAATTTAITWNVRPSKQVSSSLTSSIRSPGAAQLQHMAPPSPEMVLRAVVQTWPDDPDQATAILWCESRYGEDPDAWDLSHPDGGPMQINKATWAKVLQREFGWKWEQVVLDLEIHLAAARVVYERSGWQAWACNDL